VQIGAICQKIICEEEIVNKGKGNKEKANTDNDGPYEAPPPMTTDGEVAIGKMRNLETQTTFINPRDLQLIVIARCGLRLRTGQ
jgi:hypothetical protein